MISQPTPIAVHPDRLLPGSTLRDAPASDFSVLAEQSEADFLTSLRSR